MHRQGLQYLNTWLSSSKRKPLVLRGARQVGKSTLVRMFAKEKKLHLVEVNFETSGFKSLLQESLDVDAFITECESLFQTHISSNSILFLDEIQKSPKAFMMLRYFYEKHPEIPVIAAGSLLEFIFDDRNISVPVGRIEYFYLGPMNFLEFLWAIGDQKLADSLSKGGGFITLGQFNILQKRLHEFMFVGGMPEAVQAYVSTKNPQKVRRIQNNIWQTYIDDFPKYAKAAQFEKIQFVFSKIHHFYGQKIKYSEISSDYQSKQIRSCLELLEKAGVIYRCFNTSANGLSLQSTADEYTYKCYDLDIGLWLAKLDIPWEDIIHLEQNHHALKGFFYEQFIAQHLVFLSAEEGIKNTLYYWLRDKKSEAAEIDFLIPLHGKILPLEVKSSKSGALKSLHQFMGEKKKHTAVRMDTSERCLDKDNPKAISTFYYDHTTKKSVAFQLYQLHLIQVMFLKTLIKF